MQGRDVVGIAKTGSGKTLAFLAPAFVQIIGGGRRNSPDPFALVMAPTRELATQIQSECERFGRSSGIRSVCLYGGAPKGGQLAELRRGARLLPQPEPRDACTTRPRHVHDTSTTRPRHVHDTRPRHTLRRLAPRHAPQARC